MNPLTHYRAAAALLKAADLADLEAQAGIRQAALVHAQLATAGFTLAAGTSPLTADRFLTQIKADT